MPDFAFDGVRASQSSCLFFFPFFFTFFLFNTSKYVRNPDTKTTDSTRAVQGACYNQLAATLYTPAACHQSRKQHHTRAVVCPRCITAVASYLIVGCFCYSDPAISRPAGLCCCVIHAAATGTTTQIFHNLT